MEQMTDIRWKQRLSSYKKALAVLRGAVALSKERDLTELEQQGLIQSFEFTHELSWKLLKDFLAYQGVSGVVGSRDAVRSAYNQSLISDADVWMEMIESRNLTSYTYNDETAKDIVRKVCGDYEPLFEELMETMGKYE
ncbi:MAG: nucleotidyltransferase substrate binding protein [Treponema sp.]|nr:nucleotidyltransferase substrate binding protein [Treponema sp.]